MADEKISYQDYIHNPSIYNSKYGEADHYNCIHYGSSLRLFELKEARESIKNIHYFYTIEARDCLLDAFKERIVNIKDIMDYYDKVDFTIFRNLCIDYKDELDEENFNKIFNQLIEKEDSSAKYCILALTGLDGEGKLSQHLKIKHIEKVHDFGCTSKLLDEMYSNYEKIKQQNKGINSDNEDFTNIILLTSNFQEKYSSKFISDVIEYGGGMEVLLKYKDDFAMLNMEIFLIKNGLYSRKMVHAVLHKYSDNRELFDNLTKLDRLLSDYEINSLNRYIHNEEKLSPIKNIYELNLFGDSIVNQIRDKFRDEQDFYKLKEMAYISLFGITRDEFLILRSSCHNIYLQDRMKKEGLLDVEDYALLAIVDEIESVNALNIELFKEKFSKIITHNISLYKTYRELEIKIKNYYLHRLNDEEFTSKIKKGNVQPIQYDGKEIPVYELDGESFKFSVHAITDSGNDTKVVKKDILHNPNLWNEIDIVSSISTSLISDKYIGIAGRGAVLLGFSNLPNDSLIDMVDTDGMLTHGYNAYEPHMGSGAKELTSPQRLIKNTYKKAKENGTANYNEVGYYRKNNAIIENQGKIQPDFIALIDTISPAEIEKAKKFAAYFGVPIVIIKKEVYEQKNREKVEKYKSGAIERFTASDAREIMELPEFTEDESIKMIMNYLSKMDLKEEQEMVDEIKNMFIDYFISDPKRIDIVLQSIDQIVESKNVMEVGNNGRHK